MGLSDPSHRLSDEDTLLFTWHLILRLNLRQPQNA